MRRIGIGVTLVVGLLVLLSAVSFALIETGEVVVLHTTDDRGEVSSTRLWVVDYDGSPWIGAGRSNRRWLARLRANPRVELVRAGRAQCHLAQPVEDSEIVDTVLALFQEKYRTQLLGSRFFNWLAGRRDPTDRAVIHLDPCREHTARGRSVFSFLVREELSGTPSPKKLPPPPVAPPFGG